MAGAVKGVREVHSVHRGVVVGVRGGPRWEQGEKYRATIVEMVRSLDLPPTVGEVADELSISKSQAARHITTLVERGVLARIPGRARSLHIAAEG